MLKSDFKTNKTVYLLILQRNRGRIRGLKTVSNEDLIIEAKVAKVGRKFITVSVPEKRWIEAKFDIDNDFHERVEYGGPIYKLYLDKQDILDDLEKTELYDKTREYFNEYQSKKEISLEQLRKITAILNE